MKDSPINFDFRKIQDEIKENNQIIVVYLRNEVVTGAAGPGMSSLDYQTQLKLL